jgi:hypothetical protein
MAARRKLEMTIDVAAMAHAEKMNRVLGDIDGVNDAVIAHSKPAAIRAFQAMMRESRQTSAHLVDPGLDSGAEIGRKLEKRSVEAGVEDLEGAHQALDLTYPGANALRFFLLGLLEGGLEFRSELELVFQNVIEQTTELREFSPRK